MKTDEEYKAGVEQVWQIFDGDQSGTLDGRESKEFLKVVIKELTGNDATEDELERVIINMDTDGSGDVDKEEAIKYLKGMKLGMQLRRLSGAGI